jgi:hypothetical protein
MEFMQGLPTPERLPATIRYTEIVPVAENFGINLGYGSAENLALILDGVDFDVRSHSQLRIMDTQRNFVWSRDFVSTSTVGNPAVLVEDGASFCTLLALVDQEGNAATVHYPYTGDSQSLEETVSYIDRDIPQMVNSVGPNGLLIVTGTNYESIDRNLDSTPVDDEKRQDLIAQLLRDRFPNQNIQTLFVRPDQSSYNRLTPWQERGRGAIDIARRLHPRSRSLVLPAGMRDISGLVVVPRQISRDGKTSVLLNDRKADRQKLSSVLFPEKYIHKVPANIRVQN